MDGLRPTWALVAQKMANKLACLNARGLRDRSKATRLLRDLLSFDLDVVAMQATSMLACCLTTLLSI